MDSWSGGGGDMAPEYGTESATIDIDGDEKFPATPNLAQDLGFWMTRLPQRLRSLPIVQLAIPGSHNTMTYTIERNNDVGPDESKMIRTLGRYFGVVTKPVIFNWSVNQYESVKDQLDGGIRYLDLRVATKPNDDKVYFLHGLYGSEIGEPLREVANWLDAHPRELVILDFQHFYDFEEVRHRGLIDQLRAIFHRKMCPVSHHQKLDHTSLDWLASERYQALIVYRNPIAREYRDLWPSGLWPTPWPNTVSTSKLVDFLDAGLRERSRDTGFVSQCLLTPSTAYVARHICGSLHRDLSAQCRRAILPWLERCSPGSGGLNIVITDFVSFDQFSFSKLVVQRNASLLKHKS
ncbi:PI-PLC X domain-containing protein 3 [Copidosoma floridanum]|uniref:PI-PLC X domain-containing protein 3 n=1 Tax=Copidosoma floridanum TaxID=29053 RepID=UPI0006C98D57|nr:PI-PLC X domain-containing protein 3 [Copidosoma floridanum]